MKFYVKYTQLFNTNPYTFTFGDLFELIYS